LFKRRKTPTGVALTLCKPEVAGSIPARSIGEGAGNGAFFLLWDLLRLQLGEFSGQIGELRPGIAFTSPNGKRKMQLCVSYAGSSVPAS
jgi:hypothetical protein